MLVNFFRILKIFSRITTVSITWVLHQIPMDKPHSHRVSTTTPHPYTITTISWLVSVDHLKNNWACQVDHIVILSIWCKDVMSWVKFWGISIIKITRGIKIGRKLIEIPNSARWNWETMKRGKRKLLWKSSRVGQKRYKIIIKEFSAFLGESLWGKEKLKTQKYAGKWRGKSSNLFLIQNFWKEILWRDRRETLKYSWNFSSFPSYLWKYKLKIHNFRSHNYRMVFQWLIPTVAAVITAHSDPDQLEDWEEVQADMTTHFPFIKRFKTLSTIRNKIKSAMKLPQRSWLICLY